MDEHFVPKLSNLLLSIILPEGETYVEDYVKGTLGYLAPEYLSTQIFIEKIEVYVFGVILLQILTGQRAIIIESGSIASYASRHVRIHGINGIVDPKILEEGSAGILYMQLFQAVFHLAARCTKKRPTSTKVAKQLQRIQKIVSSLFSYIICPKHFMGMPSSLESYCRGMLGISEDDFVPNPAQFSEAAT